jgi:cytochrome P450
MVTVSSPEIAKEIMKTHDVTFASRPISTTLFHTLLDYKKGILFAPYGEYWRQVRKICNQELLGLKKVQSFAPIRKEEVTNLIESIESDSLQNKVVNLTKKLEVMVNDITMRTMLGHKSKLQDSYLDVVRKVSELGGGFNLVDMFPSSRLVQLLSPAMIQARKYRKYVNRCLDLVIKQQKERKFFQRDGEVEDLLSVLLKMHEEGTADVPLEMDNVKAMITVSSLIKLTIIRFIIFVQKITTLL